MSKTESMVRKVARAIHYGEIQHFIPGAFGFDALDAGRQEQLDEMARAAIEAMREPSLLIMHRVLEANRSHPEPRPLQVSEEYEATQFVLAHVVAAALSEEGE